ncbi:MAG: hypothetical protein F6K48_08930 [Okeania sp. SIO3H1]|uniref:hypothetical protein n=1 Tax=Okeania sp. SIO1I7 TaxID=2607772 RepID=UPI0013C5E077|nr:hypothetical protein [Okeania sp. SIO1I7]NEN89024.1 hypothetical protein [Okeania sp. SIO3H1]NET27291.1 hypothetical protein [Okeania sp. SIO1I7]
MSVLLSRGIILRLIFDLVLRLNICQNLVGKLILAVTNLPPRQVANFMSEVLVLGVVMDNGEVALIHPDRDVLPGRRIL